MKNMVLLGKKQMLLRYTVNSVCCLEERFQKALHWVLCTDVMSVRALLWCGLLHQDSSLTLEKTGEMLDEALAAGQSLAALGKACADALGDAGFFRAAEGHTMRPSHSAASTSA